MEYVDRRQVEWREVEGKFDQLAVPVLGRLPAVKSSDFVLCIGMEETPEFASELLRALRGRKNDCQWITKPELLEYWRRINDTRLSSRVQIFLDMCRNVDGEITEKEMKQVIRLSAAANHLSMSQQEVGEYTRLIMEAILGETSRATRTKKPHGTPPSAAEVLVRANWRQAWVVSLWLIACAALFTWKFEQYRRRRAFEVMGYCLSAAKGAAETLKLNMALVLLPICRNTVTWLRRQRLLSSLVPFNDAINFHKRRPYDRRLSSVAGRRGIVVGVILHGGTHLACDFPRIAGADQTLFRQTIAANFRHRQPTYLEILATTEVASGIAMVVLMAAAFALATRLPRRDPASLPRLLRRIAGFNTFWYSHHIFVVVYVLLIIHSMFLFLTKDVTEKTTWMYIAVPVLLYIGERAIRTSDPNLKSPPACSPPSPQATTYAGKVLSLRFQKPAGFRFRSGMYIYMQCPSISAFEWHPFSLTSAPDEEHLSVHIRTLGDWSCQIYSLFREGGGFPKVRIDGPYGAASQDHAKYDVIVLIGLGIGATPFVSVLKDIAYFYWVTRDQSSFDWFRDVMKEVSAANQKQAVVEMHNYLTSIYKDGDARSTVIGAAQALYYARSGLDIVSRTPVLTHFARPNWARVFYGLTARHQGKQSARVFYCGPPALAGHLRRLCHRMTTKSLTRFVFHKENY
ncbi:unnamed protein product [Spirodela intermedia]|uniref:FAD-binding FR-type domain-containing protein n=1 Tax=Spirodela intermedia TaxID=51605 RepID=A0A7I8I7K8_SPIIN|nr:unnamed protein product [Spirodela intermedia]CAA6653519.1 unnamed protein product [Spirodela intermedia]